jgi:hypothetical protein
LGPVAPAAATQAGETWRPITRSNVGLQAVDVAAVVRQLAPDREQKAGHDMERSLAEFGELCDLGLPRQREGLGISLPPCGRRQRIDGDRRALERAPKPYAALDGAVIEHDAGRGYLHRRPVRRAVEEQPVSALHRQLHGLGERQRLAAVSTDTSAHSSVNAGWVILSALAGAGSAVDGGLEASVNADVLRF